MTKKLGVSLADEESVGARSKKATKRAAETY